MIGRNEWIKSIVDLVGGRRIFVMCPVFAQSYVVLVTCGHLRVDTMSQLWRRYLLTSSLISILRSMFQNKQICRQFFFNIYILWLTSTCLMEPFIGILWLSSSDIMMIMTTLNRLATRLYLKYGVEPRPKPTTRKSSFHTTHSPNTNKICSSKYLNIP